MKRHRGRLAGIGEARLPPNLGRDIDVAAGPTSIQAKPNIDPAGDAGFKVPDRLDTILQRLARLERTGVRLEALLSTIEAKLDLR